MSEINALSIQKSLQGRKTVSIPWVQREYNLDYSDAKVFVEQLALRGWIQKECDGIGHSVICENLKLRTIAKNEVDTLFEEMTGDCISAIRCISRYGGADFSKIAAAVRGEDDTREAISVLQKNNLVYVYDNIYYCCVSRKAVMVLTEVVRRKGQMESSKGRRNNSDESDQIKKLFEELFD